MAEKKIIIKDSTLRESMDTPGVFFTFRQRLKIARLLERAGVDEIEIIAPSRVSRDLEFAKLFRKEKAKIKTSGLAYAFNPDYRREIDALSRCVDRFDILMPVSLKRKPFDKEAKISCLLKTLDFALQCCPDVGVGFPHATQVKREFLLAIGREALRQGARRITVYDTNGSADPFQIRAMIASLRKEAKKAQLFFHAHNDLGMATANSLAAAFSGIDGLDVTVNGLGDRAGNASLEQVTLGLILRGFKTQVKISQLKLLSATIEKESTIKLSKLAPVVGEYALSHKSPAHFENTKLFEAFNPHLLGHKRKQ